MEDRSTPAVVQFVVDTDSDQPDLNPGDNVPLTQAGKVSLRSVFDHVVANGNGNDSYVINFLFPPQAVLIIGQPPPPPPTMTIPLGSPLPAVVNRDIKIIGTGDRAVTLTRDPNAQPTDYYRFLSVGAVGKLEVDGLKMTGAINRGNDGGAIFNGVGGTLTVKNCYFASNLAEQGGAIDNSGQLTVSAQGAGVAKTEFLGNTTNSFGGAIHTGAGVADIHDAAFTDNVAGGDDPGRTGTHKGGAIASNIGGALSVTGCTFTANRAQEGGAIYADAPGGPPGPLTFTVTDSTFQSNLAVEPPPGPIPGPPIAKGGAIYSGGNNARLTGCSFQANQSGGEGGGVYQFFGNLVLDTCAFINNTAAGPLASNDVANKVAPLQPTTVVLINTVVAVVMV